MHNYALQETQAQQRRAQAVAEAENHRLAKEAQPGNQMPLASQLLASIGGVLVEVGSRLQEQRSTREQPAVYHMESSSL